MVAYAPSELRPTLTQQRTPGTRWAGAVLVLALLLPSFFAAPAAGDAIADKKAEAARLSQSLETQSRQLAILAESYNAASLRATDVSTSVTRAKTQMAATDAQAGLVRTRVKSQAVTAYVHGGSAQALGLILGNHTTTADMVIRRQYIETVAGNTKDALDELRAVRLQLDEQQTQLDAAKQGADAALQQAEAARRKAAQAQAQLQSTLSQVQGDVAKLVDAEAKRRAAEDARRMQAALAAKKAAEAAAAQARAGAASSRGRSPSASASGVSTGLPPAAGAEAAVAEAKRQLGKPYHYGSAGPDSFDCSGLTMWSWAHAGKSLPHSAEAQRSATTRVSIDEIQPGDLVFFGKPSYHMGMYVGDGQMIHAPETGKVVSYASIYRSDLAGVGRVN